MSTAPTMSAPARPRWIDRAELATDAPTAEDISRLVRRGFALKRYRPRPFPRAATKLLELTGSEDVDFEEVAQVVESDVALSAEILRVVNTATYLRGAAIESIEQAVNRLGFTALREVASQAAMEVAMQPAPAYAPIFTRVQRHAVLAAHCTRPVMKMAMVRDRNAYLAALFHDVGVGAVLMMLSDVYEDEPPPLDAAWPEIDRIHGEVGWHLLRRWGIPEPIPNVVRRHHSGRDRRSSTADIVVVADHLALRTGPVPHDAGDEQDPMHVDRALFRLGLTVADLDELEAEARQLATEVVSV